MAISIESLQRRDVTKPPIGIFYGTGGIGKNFLACGAAAPVVLAIEDGLGGIDVPHWMMRSYSDVMSALGALYTEEHDRKTMIIDSLDWLEPLVWQQTCSKNGWADIEAAGFGKGYVAALNYWRDIFDGIKALRDEKGMTVLLIAHHTIKRFDDPASEPYDRYVLKLQDRASNYLIEASDFVGFMKWRVNIAKTDVGFQKKVARGVGAGERLLHLEERPGYFAKNRYGRYGMPPTIEVPNTQDPAEAWHAFAQYLPTVGGQPKELADQAARDLMMEAQS